MAVEKVPEVPETPATEASEESQTRFIPISRIRDHVKAVGFRFSPEALGKLDDLVEKALAKAMERAKANKRSTIQSHDI